MGRANGAAFAMYASTRGSFLGMEPPEGSATLARRLTDRHGEGTRLKTLLIRLLCLGGLAAVVVFALLPLRGPVSPLHDDSVDGIVTVPAGGWREFQLPVFFSIETNPVAKVEVRPIGPSPGDLDVLLLSEVDLQTWRNKLEPDPIFARRGSQMSFTAALPRPGHEGLMGLTRFYVVFSNRRSAATPRTVRALVRHEWIPTAQIRVRQ